MTEQLKDLLKLPFRLDKNGDIVNSDGLIIARSLLHTSFSYAYPDNRDLLQANGEFIVAALNEKWERDFGEPKRWEKVPEGERYADYDYTCPKCNKTIYFYEGEMIDFDYCPHCGVKLDPPEK